MSTRDPNAPIPYELTVSRSPSSTRVVRRRLGQILALMAAYAPSQYWVPAVKGVNDQEPRGTWWFVKDLRRLAGLPSSDESWPGPSGLSMGPLIPTTLPGQPTTRAVRRRG